VLVVALCDKLVHQRCFLSRVALPHPWERAEGYNRLARAKSKAYAFPHGGGRVLRSPPELKALALAARQLGRTLRLTRSIASG
jgi:hypothetical protein